MQIDVKGRNLTVTDDLRERVEKRFAKVAKQVSELARLEVEVSHERNPAIAEAQGAEAAPHLKGGTPRAREAARDLPHAVNLCGEDRARPAKRQPDHRPQRPAAPA